MLLRSATALITISCSHVSSLGSHATGSNSISRPALVTTSPLIQSAVAVLERQRVVDFGGGFGTLAQLLASSPS